MQPVDTVFESSSQITFVSLECVAEAYPTPEYKWYKLRVGEIVEIDPLEDRFDIYFLCISYAIVLYFIYISLAAFYV